MYRILALALLVVLSGVTVGRSQQPEIGFQNRPVKGLVVDQQNQPVADVAVRCLARGEFFETKTDANGRFELIFDAMGFHDKAILAEDTQGKRMGIALKDFFVATFPGKHLTITLEPTTEMPVVVLDAKGDPVGAADVCALFGRWPDANSQPIMSTKTNFDGKATLRWPQNEPPRMLYVFKPNVGFEYRTVFSDFDKTEVADWLNKAPITLKFAESQTLQLQFVDSDANPIEGIEVKPWLIVKPDERYPFGFKRAPTLFQATSDAEGFAVFFGFPKWKTDKITFHSKGTGFYTPPIQFVPQDHPNGLMRVELERLVKVSGRASYPSGAAGSNLSIQASGVGYGYYSVSMTATTNERGEFELNLPPNRHYALAAAGENWVSPLVDGIIVQPDTPISDLLIEACPTTRVYGRVMNESDNKPVANRSISLKRVGRGLDELPADALPNPDRLESDAAPFTQYQTSTNEGGYYEFLVGPGSYEISIWPDLAKKSFQVETSKDLEIDLKSPQQQ